jgi:uncharacterized protein YkwD
MSTKVILLVLLLVAAVWSALDLNSLRNLELAKHNAYRALHGVPALIFNSTLNTIAQNYSQVMFNKHQLLHSTASSGKYG